jgi:citrate synthase
MTILGGAIIFASGFVVGLVHHWIRDIRRGDYIHRLKREDETYTEWQERIK